VDCQCRRQLRDARNGDILISSELPDSTRRKQLSVWLLRLCGPLPGALTGAAAGFYLYFRQPGLNTDTVAPLVFAGFWAFVGMLCGALLTGVAAWLIHRSLQRRITTSPLTTAGLTLAGLIVLCLGLYAPLQARLPALLWPAHPQESVRPQPSPGASPCTQPPPSDANARKSWELECR
jgi:hypothetical protein